MICRFTEETMTASQPRPVTLGPLESVQPEAEAADIRFVLRRSCVQAYVTVSTEAGRRIAFEKLTWRHDAWRLTLQLKPGTYRYRYYISDGSSTAYFSPADADEVGHRTRMDGIDGVFEVEPAHRSSAHPPRDLAQFKPSLRPGISSLPVLCEGAFF
jgi:hypothetical protein